MKIDKLPVRLLVGAACLYLFAMAGFAVLVRGYRLYVPQACAVVVSGFGQRADGTLLLQSSQPLPGDGRQLTVKYFDRGIPHYLQLEQVERIDGAAHHYRALPGGTPPGYSTDSLAGFVHLMKPIDQPLLSFLLE